MGMAFNVVYILKPDSTSRMTTLFKAKMELKLNVNILKRADWTPLMMAALKKKSLNVIRLLVEAGADIKQRNKDGWTALNIARISTSLVLDSYFPFTGFTLKLVKILNIASRTGDVDSFEYLLSLDPSGIFVPGYNGRTILHTICVNASTDIYGFLVGNLPIDDIIRLAQIEDNSGGTCCHEIVIKDGAIEILKSLLSILPRDSWIKPDKTGYTSLHYACESGLLNHFESILDIHQLDSDVFNMRTNEGLTLLHIAAKNKHIHLVNFLEQFVDSSALDKYNRLYTDL